MYDKLFVLPYDANSEGAKALADSLGVLRIKPDETSKYTGRNNHTIINWGNSRHHVQVKPGHFPRILNRPEAIRNATNKHTTFQLLRNNGVLIPKYTTNITEASQWLSDRITKRVFCRSVLNGSGGEGIHIARETNELIRCPLYVEGIRKNDEFRVHVVNERVIDYAAKRRKTGALDSEDYEPAIRNLANGWIFARENITLPTNIANEAIKAVMSLGLEFGAVDIIQEFKSLEPRVLEVNTSPGLQGTTLNSYTNAFKSLMETRKTWL